MLLRPVYHDNVGGYAECIADNLFEHYTVTTKKFVELVFVLELLSRVAIFI